MSEPLRPVAAVLVAAGAGRRMGADKLWIELLGRPAWRWSLDALLAVPGMQRVAVVIPADAEDRFAAALPVEAADRCLLVTGGDARRASRRPRGVTGVGQGCDRRSLCPGLGWDHRALRPRRGRQPEAHRARR